MSQRIAHLSQRGPDAQGGAGDVQVLHPLKITRRDLLQGYGSGGCVVEVEKERPLATGAVGHKSHAGHSLGRHAQRLKVQTIGLQAVGDAATKGIVADGGNQANGPAQAGGGAGKDSGRAAGERAGKGPRAVERLIQLGAHDLYQCLACGDDGGHGPIPFRPCDRPTF